MHKFLEKKTENVLENGWGIRALVTLNVKIGVKSSIKKGLNASVMHNSKAKSHITAPMRRRWGYRRDLGKIGRSSAICWGYVVDWIDQCIGRPKKRFFSSPEHNVLRGSYCDRSSSVVRPSVRPSVHLSVR